MSAKPTLLIIAHTYSIGEHAKKMPSLARYFDVTCATVRGEKFGQYGIEGSRFVSDRTDDSYNRVELATMGSIQGGTAFVMKGLSSLIRSRRWDYVLMENEPWALLKWQTLLACRLSGKVKHYGEFTWENVLRPGIKGAILSAVYHFTARWADFWICGNKAAGRIVEDFGTPSSRVLVCPQVGVDTVNHHIPAPAEKRALRAALGIPADACVVGFAGRFTPEKGVRDVLQALEQMPPGSLGGATGLHFALMGHGVMGDELQKKAASVDWLHVYKAVPHHELPRFLQCLDILALGSHALRSNSICWEEQFGHVMIEAIACGAIAIGSTSGAIPEVLGDAELTFPPGDVAAISRLLLKLSSDPIFAAEKRTFLTARLQQHFTHDAVTDRLSRFLLALP